MAAYARQAKDQELILWATEIKVRAERRAGEMLAQMPKAKGAKFNGRAPDGSFRQSHDDSAQTLADIGVTPVQSSRWQQLASMTEEHFEAAVATAKDTAGQVTTAFMLREASRAKPHKKLSGADKKRLDQLEQAKSNSMLIGYARMARGDLEEVFWPTGWSQRQTCYGSFGLPPRGLAAGVQSDQRGSRSGSLI